MVGIASLFSSVGFASEAELKIPALNTSYTIAGSQFTGTGLMWAGMVVAVLGMLFGLMEFMRIRKLPAHKSMLEVSALIMKPAKRICFSRVAFWRFWNC
jgi:K(+)-stimulated pyrophosphate-energized sodium pump